MTTPAPADTVTLGTWRFRAECRTANPGLFFPAAAALSDQAKRICSRCPVRTECLYHALTAPERFGIWGGTTADERQHMHKPADGSVT